MKFTELKIQISLVLMLIPFVMFVNRSIMEMFLFFLSKQLKKIM